VIRCALCEIRVGELEGFEIFHSPDGKRCEERTLCDQCMRALIDADVAHRGVLLKLALGIRNGRAH